MSQSKEAYDRQEATHEGTSEPVAAADEDDVRDEARLRAWLVRNRPSCGDLAASAAESAADPDGRAEAAADAQAVSLLATMLGGSPFPFEADLERPRIEECSGVCDRCNSPCAAPPGGASLELVVLCTQCQLETLRSAPPLYSGAWSEATSQSPSTGGDDPTPHFPNRGCCEGGRECYRQYRVLCVERFAHISAEIARLSQQQESEQAGLDGASKAVQHYQGTGKLEVVAAKAEGMARGAREREVVGEPAGAELKPTRGAVKMARVQLKSAGAELAEFQVKTAQAV
jgi:hypothetical protein